MASQLVINAHINALRGQRLGQLIERTRAFHLETERDQRTRPGGRTRLDRDTPRPLVGTQPNLISATPRNLSPQHIGREACPLLDRTLKNDVTQCANSAHGVLSCLDLRLTRLRMKRTKESSDIEGSFYPPERKFETIARSQPLGPVGNWLMSFRRSWTFTLFRRDTSLPRAAQSGTVLH
jgi:hypothetical protein